jgi:hypothetical protein
MDGAEDCENTYFKRGIFKKPYNPRLGAGIA